MREFNITGVCVPKKHYMVDISDKLSRITAMIDKGNYFTINRGRQYGKTTTFSRLQNTLQNRYTVLRFSFEGVGDDGFKSEEAFLHLFVEKVAKELKRNQTDEEIQSRWQEVAKDGRGSKILLERLSDGITELCQAVDKPILLMIDEVDKSSENQVFLNFLGMLRNKYLDAQEERDTTFHSVVLAGVYDIKNLKLRLRPDAERKYNSPWNIAVDFDVDMSFSAKEIATMLESYEADAHTGMDIREVSEKLRFYTGGYPVLVSWLCKWMDEKGGKLFTEEHVTVAVREMLKATNMLFDDMLKKMDDNPEFARMIEEILLEGKEFSFVPTDPVISLGAMFGIFSSRNGKVIISNVIFETCLYNHLLMRRIRQKNDFTQEKSQFITECGELDMPQILRRFQALMQAEYRERDEKFYERQGGLLFLCFLKPIINGVGNYYVEPQTRNDQRTDIVVFYERKEYIIELKIWRGEKYRQKGLEQLGGYMKARKAKNGYLVSFSFNNTREQIARKIKLEFGDGGEELTIYEVIV